ncbi:MAG: glycosyltransferase family 39 protein, partial [Aggregatilineales bacterium]
MAAHTRSLSPAANSGNGVGRGWLLFALLIVAAFLVRFSVEPVNTVFYDEAVNATLGREALAGDFSQNATAWTFGSYLYPLTAGVANAVGGEVGLRLWSAALSLTTLVSVFGTTLRLFGLQAALWAGLLFGLAGGSISLGQLAVYDTLSAPLLALALLCMARAAFAGERAGRRYLLAAAALYSLSALSKYIALLYFLALLLSGLALLLARRQPLRPLFTVFAPVVLLILGAYLLLNYEALLLMFTNSGTLLRVASSRLEIARAIAFETGPLLPAVAL